MCTAVLSPGGDVALGEAATIPQSVIAAAEALLAHEQSSLERALLAAAPDAILLVDADGTVVLANPAVRALTGHDPGSLVGRSLNVLLPAELRSRHDRWLSAYFERPYERPMGRLLDLQLCHRHGHAVPVDVSLAVCTANGRQHAVVFLRDISDQRRLTEQMRYQATHDVLTGLDNRAQFMEHLQRVLAAATRHGRPAALLLLDLDDFKGVNDGHGHAAGDCVLIEVARRLRAVLRAGDGLARLGGDEFAVLLPDIVERADAQAVAAKLLAVLAEPYALDGFTVHPGASIGIACCPQDAADPATLLRYADMAMYAAKRSGRNAYAVFDPAMGREIDERLQLQERLQYALRHGGLSLHYQPQVEVATGRMIGVEALLRWDDPVLGEVSPARLIPVAESSGLILPLGDWVLAEACRQLSAWRAQGVGLRMAVNLSALQFRQRDLPERVEALLIEHDVPPAHLELEITESEAVADPVAALGLLSRLHQLGIRVALDDFGTGHSSLAALRRLPVQRLKIDRGFLRGVPHDRADTALLRGVVALARNLDLQVVAEGVETPEQLAFVREIRCALFQGWLYAPAMPASGIVDLWREQGAVGQPSRVLQVLMPKMA